MTKTILLADDEPHLRTLVRTTLDAPGVRVLEASDGRIALDLVRSERPDVLLLDWMMPELSGIEVLSALRDEGLLDGLPVVMLTARGQDKDRERALALGVRHYLVKPFSPLELMDMVESLLEQTSAKGESALTGDGVAESGLNDAQLALYVRDLKRSFEAERARARELAKANQRLERLNQLKSEFLTLISQDLRNALNGVAAVDLYDPESSRDEQADTIAIIRDGYERLHELVCKGLEYIEWAGIEEISQRTRVDLAAIVRSAVERRSKARLRVSSSISQQSCQVLGVEMPLARVVDCLLDDSLKRSPVDAAVEITLHAHEERVQLRICDRGAGLDAREASMMFKPFSHDGGPSKRDGTGLGLAIAAKIIDAHGGSVRVESGGLGSGTSFIVALPHAMRAEHTQE